MTELPRDIQDLHLAPVALAVEARIAELATLTDAALVRRVALESDLPDWSYEMRTEALVRCVGHLIDLHGWRLAWDDRGIRMLHHGHSLVLGIPDNVRRYAATATGETAAPAAT